MTRKLLMDGELIMDDDAHKLIIGWKLKARIIHFSKIESHYKNDRCTEIFRKNES